MLFPCFKDPNRVISHAVDALAPGGFLEIQDAILWFRCDDGPVGPIVNQWQVMLHDAASKSGRDWLCPGKYKEYMSNAGLVNVEQVEYRWPVNPWPVEEHEQNRGVWTLDNLCDDWVESLSMVVMIEQLGMTQEEVRNFLTCVLKEISDKRIHAYIPM